MTRALVLALLLSLLPACGGDRRDAPVVASAYPVAFVARAIAGKDLAVDDVTPAGTEPHDIELTPGDVRVLAEADLVLYIGGGFQPAIEDAVADAARAVDVLEGGEAIDNGDGIDPHVWLDPVRLVAVAGVVAEELIRIAPAQADSIEERRDDLQARLVALDDEFADRLGSCERRSFIVSHDAFGYLADRYSLDQIPVSGLDPEGEPQPARIAEVIEIARETGATTIFYEELVSPAVAEAIAAEANLDVSILDPIESEPGGGDYFTAMTANLHALAVALGCAR